ncbi:hypothetical protein ACUL41_04530 [Virgibacillus natechei]
MRSEKREFDRYEEARKKVGREYVYFDHGIDEGMMKMMGIVGSAKPVFTLALLPKIFLISMGFNDFIKLHNRKVKQPDGIQLSIDSFAGKMNIGAVTTNMIKFL